jgi:hypothetical protein
MKRNGKGKLVVHWGFASKHKTGSDKSPQNITIKDISSDASIVVGRGGVQMAIDQRAISHQQDFHESGNLNHTQFDDLLNEVQTSPLPDDNKQTICQQLEALRQEVESGEAGDIRLVREALSLISQLFPPLREPLWHWLEEVAYLSTPMKIIARQLLT